MDPKLPAAQRGPILSTVLRGQCCETCAFFLPAPADAANLKAPVHGLCRRYPPQVQIAAGGIRNREGHMFQPPAMILTRPQIQGIDWCGEYAMRAT